MKSPTCKANNTSLPRVRRGMIVIAQQIPRDQNQQQTLQLKLKMKMLQIFQIVKFARVNVN